MKKLLKKHAEKLRFAVVGGLNTVIDFAILLTLTSIGVPAAIANYPSSTVAVIFSFFANKKYTFKATGTNLRREILLFLIFTLFCAWVIQPLTIIAILSLLSFLGSSIANFNYYRKDGRHDSDVGLELSDLFALCVQETGLEVSINFFTMSNLDYEYYKLARINTIDNPIIRVPNPI